MTKKTSFLVSAKKWAEVNKLKGPQGFLRYVMFHFVEKLSVASDDFVFKGGNLLWVYINTPRATIDLDFITLKNNSDQTIKETIEKVCQNSEEIKFTLKLYKSVIQNDKTGANAIIEYQTPEGAKNQFELDIIFAVETDIATISSPVHPDIEINSASIENIILDKFSACVRFGGGNTRIKDYDDLWRLGQSNVEIDKSKLSTLVKKQKIKLELNKNWIGPDIERAWKKHQKQYPDLPKELIKIFDDVNSWIKQVQS
jgi:hypothetical protein